ncbi:MAG: sialidase family protein [Pirellulaceae bacterium]
MPHIEILGTARIDERESAFPQAVQLPSGEILCSFSVGGGPNVTGGTDWARSTDGGETWTLEGTILPLDQRAELANFLKLSLSPDGKTIYAYGSQIANHPDVPFGGRHANAVLCRSTDGGRTWSPPTEIPLPVDCSLEVSHAVLPLRSGRLLAPAATLPEADRLGEQVLVAISDDDGRTWPGHSVVFQDPHGALGYFEQKLAEFAPGRVIATAWTVSMGDYTDQPDSFAISNDGGRSWGPARSTGIQGQTMTPISLGDDRLLVLYNRRYGQQAIVMCLVTLTQDGWVIWHESMMYDAKTHRKRATDLKSGVDELDSFAFGFPTAIPLQDGSLLATHWCVENGVCGIRWTKLRVT